jgi:hypothetical protein
MAIGGKNAGWTEAVPSAGELPSVAYAYGDGLDHCGRRYSISTLARTFSYEVISDAARFF